MELSRRNILVGGGLGAGLVVAWGLWPRAYPQAAVQHLALGIVATLALCRAPGAPLRRLGLVTGAAFAVLIP